MGTWSPDPETKVVQQFEHLPVPSTPIVYTPDETDSDAPAGGGAAAGGADDAGGGAAAGPTLPVVVKHTVRLIDEPFPEHVVFTESAASLTVSGTDMLGFFDGKLKMTVKLWDDSSKGYASWEDIERDLQSIKHIYEYFPPSPDKVQKHFEVTAEMDNGKTASARFSLECWFDHTPSRDRLLKLNTDLEAKMRAVLEKKS